MLLSCLEAGTLIQLSVIYTTTIYHTSLSLFIATLKTPLLLPRCTSHRGQSHCIGTRKQHQIAGYVHQCQGYRITAYT